MNDASILVSSTPVQGKKALRSRSGCIECRRLHRKCDEKRPQCDSCISAGKVCCYQKALKWGGRPFAKSIFGKTIGAGVVAVEQEKGNGSETAAEKCFVYGTSMNYRRLPQPQHGTAGYSPISAEEYEAVYRKKIAQLSQNPEWLPWLSHNNRLLLDYFVTRLKGILSLHPRMGEAKCQTLIPRALEISHGFHLLAAILAISAIHRKTLGLSEDEDHLIRLQSTCVEHLRHQVLGRDAVVDEIFAATALCLCVGEIMNGGAKCGLWRLHLKGATAILARFKKESPSPLVNHEDLCGRPYLLRWCKTLEVISLFTGDRAHPAMVGEGSILGSGNARSFDWIDLFDGCSTGMYDVFLEIHLLSSEKDALRTLQLQKSENGLATEILQRSLSLRCGKLARQIQDMTVNRARRLEPFVEAHTSPEIKAEFDALNETYHHAALLELYQRIINKAHTDPDVQKSVEAAIRSLQRISRFEEASPAIATLRCVFTVGCSAVGVLDRAFIVGWLARMKESFGMGNVDTVSEFLLELWTRNDALQTQEGGDGFLQWTELLEKGGWELNVY